MAPRRKRADPTASEAAMRRQVRSLLEAAPAFRRMPAAHRRKLAQQAASVAAFADLVQRVDFPSFVAGLISGVFDAILDGPIRQMEAYGDLLRSVTRSVERFVTDETARAGLVERHPGLFELCADGSIALIGHCAGRTGAARTARKRAARSRLRKVAISR